MADRYSYSSASARKVKKLQFGVLDAEFLVRLAGGAAAAGLRCWMELLLRALLARIATVLERPCGCAQLGRQRGSHPPRWPRALRPFPPQRRYSVAKIDSSQTYDKGRPKLGGLSDPRLGTMDRALKVRRRRSRGKPACWAVWRLLGLQLSCCCAAVARL